MFPIENYYYFKTMGLPVLHIYFLYPTYIHLLCFEFNKWEMYGCKFHTFFIKQKYNVKHNY